MMKEYNSTGVQILNAAKALFSKYGYKGVSTKKIALTAKVNEVTIFRIFGSKEKLFEATFEYFFFKPNFDNLENLNDMSLEEFLLALGYNLHKFFKSNLSLIKIEIQSQDGIYKKQSINRFPNEIREFLSAQFQKHKKMKPYEANLQAICFMTALHGLCLNLYIFQTIAKNANYEECLVTLVNKFK